MRERRGMEERRREAKGGKGKKEKWGKRKREGWRGRGKGKIKINRRRVREGGNDYLLSHGKSPEVHEQRKRMK